MRIENGKYYWAEDGTKIGPMDGFEIKRECYLSNASDPAWRNDGSVYTSYPAPHGPLIAKCVDVDLTKITSPFCLLDTNTQMSLKAYGGQLEILSVAGEWGHVANPGFFPGRVYRAKAVPKRETKTEKCYLGAFCDGLPFFTAIDSPDFILGTYTVETEDGKPVRVIWGADE